MRIGRPTRMFAVTLTALFVAAVVASSGCSKAEVFPDDLVTSSTTATTQTTGSTSGGASGGASEVALRVSDLDPALLVGNFAICSDCHSLLDQPGKVYPGLLAAFRHGFHIEAGAACDDCHAVPTHTEDGIRTPPMQKCFSCHSFDDPAAPPGECETCHPQDFPLLPETHEDPEWLPVVELRNSVKGKHSNTSLDDREKECGFCHGTTFCVDCHKVDMPHPGGWQEGHQQEARRVGGSSCNFCHPERQMCTECHHQGYEQGGVPWVQMHPSQVEANGAQKCIGCHSTSTCAHCHVTGEYKDYD